MFLLLYSAYKLAAGVWRSKKLPSFVVCGLQLKFQSLNCVLAFDSFSLSFFNALN